MDKVFPHQDGGRGDMRFARVNHVGRDTADLPEIDPADPSPFQRVAKEIQHRGREIEPVQRADSEPAPNHCGAQRQQDRSGAAARVQRAQLGVEERRGEKEGAQSLRIAQEADEPRIAVGAIGEELLRMTSGRHDDRSG